MNSTSLDARIRSVRQGVRSRQPLDYRVALVRKRHAAAKAAAQKRIQLHLRKSR